MAKHNAEWQHRSRALEEDVVVAMVKKESGNDNGGCGGHGRGREEFARRFAVEEVNIVVC